MTRKYMRGLTTHFACGHFKNPTNTKNGGCRTCNQVRDRERRRAIDAKQFKCGHERTPDNSLSKGRGQVTCKTCKRERDQIHNRNRPSRARRTVRLVAFPVIPLPPRSDEAPELNGDRSYSFPPKRQSA